MTSEQFLKEIAQVSGVEPDFRANVPPGTPLGSTEIEPGATVNYTKASQLVRMGQHKLPERLALYDLVRHDVSMVPPTIAQKRLSDYPGRYTMVKPAGWHDSDPVPIDETCEICDADPERTERAKFFSNSQLTLHYQLVHTMEWQGIESDRRDAERREDNAQMRRLIASIAGMNGGQVPAEVADEVTQRVRRGRKESE